MGCISAVTTFLFAFFVIIFTILDYICILIIWALSKCCLSKSSTEGAALVCTKFFWTCALRASCWIRTTFTTPGAWALLTADLIAFDAAVKSGSVGQPVYIMHNHVSYLDSVVIPTIVPFRVLVRTRIYMSSHLYKIPLFGFMVKVMGHFPVWFLKIADKYYKTDPEKMKVTEARVDAHVARGGILSLFPEAQINRTEPTPHNLQPFRYGTFKRALQDDAKIWNLVMFGHEKVWPATVGLASNPARIGSALYPVTPAGARAFVEAIKAEGGTETGKEDFVILTEAAQAAMQGHYNALREAIEGSGSAWNGRVQPESTSPTVGSQGETGASQASPAQPTPKGTSLDGL